MLVLTPEPTKEVPNVSAQPQYLLPDRTQYSIGREGRGSLVDIALPKST